MDFLVMDMSYGISTLGVPEDDALSFDTSPELNWDASELLSSQHRGLFDDEPYLHDNSTQDSIMSESADISPVDTPPAILSVDNAVEYAMSESYLSPASDLPATPLRNLRRSARLHAFESLPDAPVDVVSVIAAPSMVLALIVRLDAASIVALGATCRSWHATFDALLSASHSQVRRRFGRAILETGAWGLAYTFPLLAVRTMHPSLVFKAGRAAPCVDFVRWILALPADSGVSAEVLLRHYLCGTVRSGKQHMVRAMLAELFGAPGQHGLNMRDIIDWPMGASGDDDGGSGASTFIDYLVSQTPCDAMLVLCLVQQHNVRMTAFSAARVMAQNAANMAEARDMPPSELGTLPSSLITHYTATLVRAVQEACAACDHRRIAFIWDAHDPDVVAFAANQYHMALIAVVRKCDTRRFTQAARVRAIEAILDACTRINGPALMRVAIEERSLRLFETAFDETRSNPCASTAVSEPERLSYIIQLTSRTIRPTVVSSVPQQSTPPQTAKRANKKRQRTTRSSEYETSNFIIPGIAGAARKKGSHGHQ